jgi:hypothetical protein
MKYFTQEDLNPSEKTLNILRQIAYSYRAMSVGGATLSYCLN